MIARSVFWGTLFFCLNKTQGSLGVISGQFCMINHAPEKDRKIKSHLLSVYWEFMLKEIKGDRQRDERIDIFSSPFGSLWEENYFKAAALMKEKGALRLMYSSRGGINSMNDSKVGVGGWVKGEQFLLRNESAIWQQWRKQRFPCQEMWLVQRSTLLFPVCACKNAADVIR